MIHLEWPWMLLALPLPWLLARMLPPVPPQGSTLFLPFAALVAADGAAPSRDWSRTRKIVLVACWLALVGAAVRPQWLGDPQPVPTTGRRLLLAIDVSGSMAAQDMAGRYSRLQVVQKVAGDFIDGRHGDQVGLIIFGSQAYLQAPLTPDLATVHRFLDDAVIGIAGRATAVGDAIGLALKRLKQASATESRSADTVLVLLTDGASNAGAMPPLQAAKMAADAGLKIYTIGVGAEVEDGLFGRSGNADLDEDTLQQVAKSTGGEYFRASDARALQQVYAHIDQLEPSAGSEQWYRPATDWFVWPLALAVLLSIPGVALERRR